MLGFPFFKTGQELAKATQFAAVSSLLREDLKPQINAFELVIVEVGSHQPFLSVKGDGPVAKKLSDDSQGLGKWAEVRGQRLQEDTSALCEGPTGHELEAIPGLQGWLEYTGCTDIMGGNLIYGRYRSACLAAFRQGGDFTEEERERFQAAVLVARCVLGRIQNDVYDRRCLERLMHTRRETVVAVFIIEDDCARPYNSGAVAYAESWWGKDDVEFKFPADTSARIHEKLAGSWETPVDSNWVEIELDLGGGSISVYSLARPDGGAVLLFSPPSKQAISSGNVPMLTKRQCDIMDWIAEGKTSAEVAMILQISPRTVEKHLEAVFQRLGVENRVAAMRSYLEAKGGFGNHPPS
jgi:DNA-binding CsgD family transcriptional regulator